ncbi:MAG TPA: peptidoglycan-binding protein [Microthrixaceae bacterium]|jgi:N-acetylmuramoyl-L-alanine amidase|nr:peptidoglycan-binding protein [Microthrixaceae bacterium]
MFQQLTSGDAGPEVSELHERLQALGFLAQLPDAYEDATRDAVASFQRSRGLDVSGVCDPHTWRALLEAEHQFGARALYLSSPMLRGDDVATLQLRLGSLGFNAGRVDGIFGPNTQQAVREFQRNTDLMVDGVCARDTVSQLNRLTARSSNISIAGIRERESLSRRSPDLAGLRVAVCHQGTDNGLVGALGADLHLAEAVVSVSSSDDWSALATITNGFDADVCLAIEVVDAPGVEIAYYATDGFQSEAGRLLAEALIRQLPHPPGWGPSVAHGMRLPILRETRCPTVRIKLGPVAEIAEMHSLLVAAANRALRSWIEPTP